ncbi:denticleless [Entomortierella parvispora]|uniref:Denticleless n=1 Tax=Entomortierella parvispora TaxID=205924 RepID=A0A9P3HC20_9FUNG|nr:denticleless [Entomortierella parvispora]
MPAESSRRSPLADISQRPLSSRTQQIASSQTCAGTGEENNVPSRRLLEIFSAAQAGSAGRKRSLKLALDDSDSSTQKHILNAINTTSGIISSINCKTQPPSNLCTKSTVPSRSFRSNRPQGMTSTLARIQTFGRRRCQPCYVSTRFLLLDYISRPSDVYTFISQDGSTLVPPFSCAYNNVANDARYLAVGDEDGAIHIVNTKKDDSHPASTTQILAHQNAIFDLCWTRDDSKIVSVSGDQTARLHDVETKKCLGTFSGHSGSIKSISMKQSDDNIFATAARDGNVMIWDVRCSSTASPRGDISYRPADRLINVHTSTRRAAPTKKTKHGSDGANTASAVQYMLHNDNILASTGSLDGSIKFWDVRNHGSYFRHTFPTPIQASKYTPITKRAHGMTSMALSPDGVSLFAVSSDNHIYMYNTTALDSPIQSFGGSGFACSSYYIKISVSPDGRYIAAGSSKDLYVWEIARPHKKPFIFQGPEREVTGVDWARDLGQGTELSGCSDDATVRTWKANRDLVQECNETNSLRNMHGMVTELSV